MNKVLLVGRLTRDPELRTTPGGMAVTRFSLAVSQNYVNKNGERGADFINCTVWGRQAENICKYCAKGSLISAEGRLRENNYQGSDGVRRYTMEVVCDQISFLGSRSGSTNSNYSGNTNSMPSDEFVPQEDDFNNMMAGNEPMETADLSEDPFKSFGQEITLSSDDLPF